MHDPVDTVLEGVRRFARSGRLNRQASSVSKPRRSAALRASANALPITLCDRCRV
jgi:hypothetical protein